MTRAPGAGAPPDVAPVRPAARRWRPVPLTRVGAVSLAVAAVLGVTSLHGANIWLLVVAVLLAAPVPATHLLLFRVRSLEFSFEAPARALAGTTSDHTLTAHNTGRRSTPPVQVVHRMRGFEDVKVSVPPLAGGGSATVTVPRTATGRGVTTEHELISRTFAPFGVAGRRQRIEVRSAPVLVHPAPHPPAAAISTGGGGTQTGRPARQGPDLHGLREWRPGDSLRQVHWRATARREELVVVVPELTEEPRLAVVVAGPAAHPDWEDLLRVTAWTAVDAARRGSRVRVSAVDGPEPVETAEPLVLLDWFARLAGAGPAGPALADARVWAGDDGAVTVASVLPPDLPPDVDARWLGPHGEVTPA